MQRLVPSRLALALLAALALVLSATAPAGAGATPTQKILEACSEGQLPRGYSQQDYHQALKHMPPELSEYSDCPDLIHRAQLAAAAGGGGGGSGNAGGGVGAAPVAPPTPAEQHTLERVAHTGAAPVRVGGEVIHPGVVHANIASALNTLPTPLLALLVFLLACAALVVGLTLRNRVRARRHDI